MKPSVGRIVHYVLDEDDAEEVNRRRIVEPAKAAAWPPGAQAHIGDPHFSGQHLPMIICSVEEIQGRIYVRGQVFLVGNDTLWVWDVECQTQENEPGSWHWPERVE